MRDLHGKVANMAYIDRFRSILSESSRNHSKAMVQPFKIYMHLRTAPLTFAAQQSIWAA